PVVDIASEELDDRMIVERCLDAIGVDLHHLHVEAGYRFGDDADGGRDGRDGKSRGGGDRHARGSWPDAEDVAEPVVRIDERGCCLDGSGSGKGPELHASVYA